MVTTNTRIGNKWNVPSSVFPHFFDSNECRSFGETVLPTENLGTVIHPPQCRLTHLNYLR
jgi:hypothetical protein